MILKSFLKDRLMTHAMHIPFLPPGAPETPRVSFEFFPPKTEKMEETLWASLDVLAPLGPSFVSVRVWSARLPQAPVPSI